MKTRQTVAAVVIAMAALGVSSANAAVTFVGSWQVDQGPRWTVVPPAYSGQEAAALLFGGSASEYVISTVDNNPADINNLTWVSTWGGACGGSFPCGTTVAQNSVVSTGGLYETVGDTSAYVNDWAVGSQFTNYAFLSGVPEPATWALFLLGFGAIGWTLRARRNAATA